MDEIGPGEGRLDSRGIEIPLKPAGKGGVAQFPAGSPAQATACGQSAPVTEVAGEEEDWEGVIRSPPSNRSGPSRAMGPMEPIRAPALRVPYPRPPEVKVGLAQTGVTHKIKNREKKIAIFSGGTGSSSKQAHRGAVCVWRDSLVRSASAPTASFVRSTSPMRQKQPTLT